MRGQTIGFYEPGWRSQELGILNQESNISVSWFRIQIYYSSLRFRVNWHTLENHLPHPYAPISTCRQRIRSGCTSLQVSYSLIQANCSRPYKYGQNGPTRPMNKKSLKLYARWRVEWN